MMNEITVFVFGAFVGHVVSQWFSYKSAMFHMCNQYLLRKIDCQYQRTKRDFLSLIGYKQKEDPASSTIHRNQFAHMMNQIDPAIIENLLNNICKFSAPIHGQFQKPQPQLSHVTRQHLQEQSHLKDHQHLQDHQHLSEQSHLKDHQHLQEQSHLKDHQHLPQHKHEHQSHHKTLGKVVHHENSSTLKHQQHSDENQKNYGAPLESRTTNQRRKPLRKPSSLNIVSEDL
jgi:hypothetical protein